VHVDGFRFDLASILSRDASGQVMPNPPVLWDIESDPALAGTKLIAEAWDAGGLYQVGSFIGDSWKEWNGRFRDDVRSFLRGESGAVGRFADRLLGSPEIYGHKEREVEQSINFVTCHDGFTLNDLVSYNDKHNEANEKAIATARVTIAAGIVASRAQTMIPRSRACAIARRRTSYLSPCFRWASQ
jgi:glycogen operon protein